MAYTSGGPTSAATNVCPPPEDYYSDDDLMKMFPKGVASDSLVPDASTGRISAAMLQSHVRSMESIGVIKGRPTQALESETETAMNTLVADDLNLYSRIQDEYCYYEQRYRFALRAFFEKATSRTQATNADAQKLLENTKILNLRVNGVLEVMNYLAQSRVALVNINKGAVNKRNAVVNDKMNRLRNAFNILNRDNATIKTQREMVRYTEEKNNYTTNQIALWAALNIVALGTIFYVYRN